MSPRLSRAALHVLILSALVLYETGVFPVWELASGLHKSPDSTAYGVNLKFHKLVIGAMILWASLKLWGPRPRVSTLQALRAGAIATLGAAAALIGPALATGYVRVDVSWPPHAWAWLANNLLLVCLGEEAFFRGYVQRGLEVRLAPMAHGRSIALVAASVIFGLAHLRGGPALVALSGIAGAFYGWAFRRGGISAAVLAHFGVNTVHFLFFSYPALTR